MKLGDKEVTAKTGRCVADVGRAALDSHEWTEHGLEALAAALAGRRAGLDAEQELGLASLLASVLGTQW